MVGPWSVALKGKLMAAKRDKTGRWRFRKRVRLPSGERVRISGTPATNTKAAAEAEEAREIARLLCPGAFEQAPPAGPPKEVPTVREYSKLYLELKQDLKPSDRASARQILDCYILPVFGEMRLDEVSQGEVDALKASLLAKVSRKTTNNVTSILGRLLRYAARNRLIEAPSIAFAIKVQATKVHAVPRADIEALLEACTDPRYTAAILLASECGLRIGEIRGLQWGDLDELHHEALITRAVDTRSNLGDTKGFRERIVPVSRRAWTALEALPRRSSWCISNRRTGDRLSYWAVRDALVDLYEKAELDRPTQPWHCLRHSYCTHLADGGTAPHLLQSLAGHRSFSTTLKYIDPSREAKRAAVATVFGQTGQTLAKSAQPKERKPQKR